MGLTAHQYEIAQGKVK